MTDIQHWRRMVQPAKDSKSTEPEDDASVATRRGLRPVLSSYFSQYTLSSASNRFIATYRPSEETLIGFRLPSRLDEHYASPPDVDILMDQIMIHLLDHPFEGLDVRFNGTILRILESYRDLRDEKIQLENHAKDQAYSYKSIMSRLQDAQSHWHEERQDYKSEIKRLEVLLAQGKRGLAEVTLARQNSVLRQKQQNKVHGTDDGLEAVLKVLEKVQGREEKAYVAQRATFRKRWPSPSADMGRLSRKLTLKKSFSDTRSDLPVGTPPVKKPSMSLARQAHQDDLRDALVDSSQTVRSVSDSEANYSEDSYSVYSCAGELPRHEAFDGTLVERAREDDVTLIEHMARQVARRRNIEIAEIMPKLLDLFHAGPANTLARNEPAHQGVKNLQLTETGRSPMPKQPGLIQKASGFFQKKPKPQPSPNSTHDLLLRRFSFEAGDDTRLFVDPALPVRQLRKSASMSTLPSSGLASRSPALVHSPAVPSPTTSINTKDSRHASRIPEPIFNSGGLARPRQERDSSATSLLTVIKRSEDSVRTSVSSSNFRCSPMPPRDYSRSRSDTVSRGDPERGVVSSCSPSMRAPFVVQIKDKRKNKKLSSASANGMKIENTPPQG